MQACAYTPHCRQKVGMVFAPRAIMIVNKVHDLYNWCITLRIVNKVHDETMYSASPIVNKVHDVTMKNASDCKQSS